MAAKRSLRGEPDDDTLLAIFEAITSGDSRGVTRRLNSLPSLSRHALRIGASRQDPGTFFLASIRHHVYAGDTALHIAAAAHQRDVAEALIGAGADVGARNRHGAEPGHYAADGGPGIDGWDPEAQRDMIACLIAAGADPNALDNSGVAPLHRAVRNRCASAVGALLGGGADPRLRNRAGSTPLHLAVQNTGKSGSGSDEARGQQHLIIVELMRHGARSTDVDARGRTTAEAASNDSIRQLLDEPQSD